MGGLWRNHPGLHSKVLGAAQVWEHHGAEVSIVLFSEGRVIDSKGNTICQVSASRVSKLESYYDTRRNKLLRFLGLKFQYEYLREILKDLSPDVVYARYAFPFPGVQNVFGSVCPYIIEVNSNDLVEFSLKSTLTGLYNRFFRKSLLGGARGLCFISREMSLSSSFNWYHGRTAVVANSINCQNFPFVPDTGNSQVNICFIGSPKQSWHGLDKIQCLCSRFPHWTFHIIGPEREEYLSVGGKALDNIVFHGYLSGNEASKLMMSMDIGISSLALHRKQMHEASPLKSRQYMAQGIPFITAYEDTDIKRTKSVYQLPNTEENVADNLDSIEVFIEQAFRDTGLREDSRKYAEQVLDSYVIEKKRFDFIASCL